MTWRRGITSVWPGETGNASATASAWALSSRMRPGGKEQNGQSVGLQSLIIAFDATAAQAPDLFPVSRPKLPPQARVKADVSQVAVITEELRVLERSKGLAQHQ